MHIQVDSRFQMVQWCLDELIADDNPVRALDKVIDHIFLQPNVEITTGHYRNGRPAYSAKDLTKLLLYGYINGITSCRKLANEAAINKELTWLIRNQCPGYKTIANFRKDNYELIHTVYVQMILLLQEMGFMKNKTWVIDGNKTKANAKREMESVKNLQKQINSLTVSLEQSMEDLASAESQTSDSDNTSGSGLEDSTTEIGSEARSKEDIKKEISTKEEALANKQYLLERAKALGKSYISATDEDANLLPTRRGKCAAYNVQYVADAENHMLMGAVVTDETNDRRSLYSTIKHIVDTVGSKPEVVLADTGYSNISDIKRLMNEVTSNVYVNIQRSVQDKKLDGFKFDRDADVLYCPAGKTMKRKGRQLSKGTYYNRYTITGCNTCNYCSSCANNKNNKSVTISDNYESVAEYKATMQQPEVKSMISKRKTIIEHIFGTIAQMMHFNGFKLRGMHKVSIETYLYVIAYNFKRLFALLKKKAPNSLQNRWISLAFFRLFMLLFGLQRFYFSPFRQRYESI